MRVCGPDRQKKKLLPASNGRGIVASVYRDTGRAALRTAKEAEVLRQRGQCANSCHQLRRDTPADLAISVLS